MALDRRKSLQTAERFLKQGKLRAALDELRRVSASAPNDLLTLNRLGDLLARQGRNREAIEYYVKIARQFASGGFLPKAIAIHKKILRLDTQNLDSMVELGQLYLQQNLHGEARNYLLHAANVFLEQQRFDRAREIYAALVEADPSDLRNRVRLAETRAAEGHVEDAGRELVELGRNLVLEGQAVEGEKVYKRAMELLPGAPAPLVGVSEALYEQGRRDEALALLESQAARSDAAPALVGELAWRYELADRSDDAVRALTRTRPLEIPIEKWEAIFRCYVERGCADDLWSRIDPLLESQTDAEARTRLLKQLVELEEHGHVPGLQRLVQFEEAGGHNEELIWALERLVGAYQARSMHDEASLTLDRLAEVAPTSPLVAGPGDSVREVGSSSFEVPGGPEGTVPGAPGDAAGAVGPALSEVEAPAVPLKRSDEEFVAGRLTQAEVLEKYGLHQQALEQLEEVTLRFPGHVEAQQKRVALLRTRRDRQRLADALARLAVAQRAAGDLDAARRSGGEAVAIGGLPRDVRQVLERLLLIEPAVARAVATPSTAPTQAGAESAGELLIDFDEIERGVDPAPVPRAANVDPAAARASGQGGRPTRVPSQDMLDEIQAFLSDGNVDEARRRLSALGALGYASDAMTILLKASAEAGVGATPDAAAVCPVELPVIDLTEPAADVSEVTVEPELAADPEREDRLEAGAEEPPAEIVAATEVPAEAPAPVAAAPAEPTISAKPLAAAPVEPPVPAVVVEALRPDPEPTLVAALADPTPASQDPGLFEDEDLSAITAALESELFDTEAEPLVPEEDPEQSIDDIFATFKEHVQKEVGSDDYQTHYDLGIAYKEMGLVQEAIQEFEVAVTCEELRREACSMIAMCHRDLQETERAAHWYREALQVSAADPQTASGLRYDLAEVLLESGDKEAALDEFRSVCSADPEFRDVEGRVAELETQLQS